MPGTRLWGFMMGETFVERCDGGDINSMYGFSVRSTGGCGTSELFADLDDQPGELPLDFVRYGSRDALTLVVCVSLSIVERVQRDRVFFVLHCLIFQPAHYQATSLL
jgi:hypothetical protein